MQTPDTETRLQQARDLFQQGRIEPAEQLFRDLIKESPQFEPLYYLGFMEILRGNFAVAAQLYDEALKLNPNNGPAHSNISIALYELKRYDEALAHCDRALAITPGFVEAHSNRGNNLRALAKHEEALDSFDRALALRPQYPEVLCNRGNVLLDLHRPEEAVVSYEKAVALKPDYAEALNNCATALSALGRHEAAAEFLTKLLSISPDYQHAIGALLHAKMHCCDWQGYHDYLKLVFQGVTAGKRAANPWTFLSMSASPEHQQRCAQIFSHRFEANSGQAIWDGELYRHGRIRVAYLSGNFQAHAVAYSLAGVFEAHDKTRFEITAISLGPDSQDDMRKRLETSFDRFIDARSKSDREVALLLKELEIDIAVDLVGSTRYCRPGILTLRPAPIQVNYFGTAGTLGAECIQYVLADRCVIPDDHQSFYTEKVAYLPHTYYATDDKTRIAEQTPSRAEAGLPDNGFVFCCFNNGFKITPEIFDIWMRLLRQLGGSVLWLLQSNPAVVRNLRREAEQRGVAPDRLVFAPRAGQEDHLARHQLADLFLDTLPYNAHTTAVDALWIGLPVVTCLGQTFAGRVAASLLHAIGMPELVTTSLGEYEALALRLAREPPVLAAIKAKLARHRSTCALFDTRQFCRHVESAYQTMWERYQRGEPPASFAVNA